MGNPLKRVTAKALRSKILDSKARNEQLRDLLRVALDEHDGYHGQFYADYMPEHWTHAARAALTGKP